MPAAGGSDAESVEEAKERAPHYIKSQNRAVTAEDFEMMALRASTSIAKAFCNIASNSLAFCFGTETASANET